MRVTKLTKTDWFVVLQNSSIIQLLKTKVSEY